MSNFIEKCISGEVKYQEINDFIEVWHKSKSKSKPIYEFLGMTYEEYVMWVKNPDSLLSIINDRDLDGSITEDNKMTLKEIGLTAYELEIKIGVNLDAVMHKLTQEVGEFNDAIQKHRGIYSRSRLPMSKVKSELGDVLVNLISIAYRLGINPDAFPAIAEDTLNKFKERKNDYIKNKGKNDVR